jgi:histidinol-phosphate/aromatic aminotransferase/cobyric acid decarboxylase-like protein/choline kinase
MLPINGKTLIERALDALDKAGISKCIIVVGYQKDNLMRFVGNRYKGVEITYIANDIYNKTNNIYSLYLTKDYLLQDDTLLLESDLIFEDRLIRELLENAEPTLAAVAPYESWMDGTVVQISGDTIITNFIPRKFFNYDDKQSYYKTVNIYKFSRDFLRTSYVPFLEAYSQAMGNNEYYEQVLRVIATLDKNELKAFVLSDQKWYEIDDVQDKDIAETIFSDNPEEKVRLINRRYGGYWRFPKLLDFCYLVNPYFPTEQMRNEMKAYFDELLTEYPSGLDVQNLLSGKLFNIDGANILTGNGAAELIRAALPLLSGKVGIIYPTFNEYPESLGNRASIKPLYPSSPDTMAYTAEDLLAWSEECDVLTLINPDNPSGNYIPHDDVIRLLEKLKSQGKRLILDESFIDFCDPRAVPNVSPVLEVPPVSSAAPASSVLNQQVLDKFPNLVVIKSLSKSYGIPGLRLGILAGSDTGFIKAIRKNLPIWNINSFAEYFLQIIGKYQKDYRQACGLIIAERRRFMAALEGTGLLKVYPSQANYFLCKILGDYTAGDLTKTLLEKQLIFIKDLSGKKGIIGDKWLRLAIRNRKDNDTFIEKLSAFGRA